jgi:hypothetical protein
MVFKVPHITSSVLYACSTSSYSMLGFGDILVPGAYLNVCCIATANLTIAGCLPSKVPIVEIMM